MTTAAIYSGGRNVHVECLRGLRRPRNAMYISARRNARNVRGLRYVDCGGHATQCTLRWRKRSAFMRPQLKQGTQLSLKVHFYYFIQVNPATMA